MQEKVIARAAEIIAQNTHAGTHCTLALMEPDGYPHAATITAAQSDGIRTLTFGTGLSSNWAKRIANCGRASVCFNSEQYNITLDGDIEVSTDPALKKASWYQGLENHFSGPEDPAFCVLRFTTKRYSLFVDWQAATGEF